MPSPKNSRKVNILKQRKMSQRTQENRRSHGAKIIMSSTRSRWKKVSYNFRGKVLLESQISFIVHPTYIPPETQMVKNMKLSYNSPVIVLLDAAHLKEQPKHFIKLMFVDGLPVTGAGQHSCGPQPLTSQYYPRGQNCQLNLRTRNED